MSLTSANVENRQQDREPLLSTSANYGTISEGLQPDSEEVVQHPKRQIGVVSALFIIFNRIIGTGIFATPSTILRFSGSVGLSLVLWVVGAVIAGVGMQVYIIWGTALPHNGGEKNYLEYLFPRPKRLITSLFAAVTVLFAWGGNSLIFAEYALAAIYTSPPPQSTSILSPVRLVAFLCMTGSVLLHGLHIRAGLQLQNVLGSAKLGILAIVVGTGLVALSGNLQDGVERPGNFDSWNKIWEGSQIGGSVLCTCLYNIIYSYIGFSNANYALSEMENPAKTLRIAGPLAIVTVTFFFLLCNVAYYSAASKEEIIHSGRLVAALLFRNVWGPQTERVLNAFVALAALGNVLSVTFSQGRVNQALGREDILPFSKFWASSWPANAPLAGLILYWIPCMVVIFAIPAGDAYNFVINMTSFSHAMVNGTISFGLVYLALQSKRSSSTSTPSSSNTDSDIPSVNFQPTSSLIIPALLFGLANVFLFVAPLIKPPPGAEPYENLPYWTHVLGGCFVLSVGVLWWLYHYGLAGRPRSVNR